MDQWFEVRAFPAIAYEPFRHSALFCKPALSSQCQPAQPSEKQPICLNIIRDL